MKRKNVKIIRSRVGLALIAAFMAGSVALAFTVRAYSRWSSKDVSTAASKPSTAARVSTAGQNPERPRRFDYTRLARQPEVDRMRLRLGRRFLSAGREVSALTGTLTVGGDRQTVSIVRSRNEDGEGVSIALGTGQASLAWSSRDGARLAGGAASAEERKLIERIALDSPDQFVLAQLRGATYRTLAHNVAPKGAADLEEYSGPSWDVIRVSEPQSAGSNRPLSGWRLYYINTASGLIERVVSQEDGQIVEAEFSGWAEQSGEKLPTRIVWRRAGQVVMELAIGGATHSPQS